MSDMLRAGVNLVLAVAVFILPGILFPGDFESLTADGPVPAAPSPATPAGYAFVIWLVIYALGVGYGVMQALPGQWPNSLYRQTGWLVAGLFLSIIAFLVFARLGPAWLMMPIIVVQFGFAAAALAVAVRHGFRSWHERFLLQPMLGLCAGWLTAAIVLTFTNILPEYGISIFGLSGTAFGLFTLVAVLAVFLLVLPQIRGNLWYAAAVVWALAGVIAATAGAGLLTALPLASLAGIAVVAAATLWARQRSVA